MNWIAGRLPGGTRIVPLSDGYSYIGMKYRLRELICDTVMTHGPPAGRNQVQPR